MDLDLGYNQARRWATAPNGPYAWGYCFVTENNKQTYCTSTSLPCASGKNNYNYGQAGKAVGADLINNPDLVATDPTISFKTAIWFWMTPQTNKPSSHDVIIGNWRPSAADTSAS
ncbi:endochitinase a2 [Quercus suber]|uniref:chitinase n=1 Tax=Quercus suber TaxID=58331 RepID=A0AAW0JPX2_QUESU